MSGCATVSNDLYYIIYTYMRNGKMTFSQLMRELSDSLDCQQYNPDYENLKKKAKTVYDLEFMAESTSYVTTNKLAYAIFKVYDTTDLSEDQIVEEIKATYPNLKNNKDINELASEVLEKIKQKYSEGNVDISPRTIDIIERNISLDSPDEDYMSIPRKEILEFIRMKGYKVPAKNLPKSGLLAYIKKSYQGKTKQAPPSPRDSPSKYEAIKDFDVCNTRAYNKQQLYDYIKFKGWKLKHSTNSKEYLCKFIKEQSKQEGEVPSRPSTPIPSKKVSREVKEERKYREEEEEEEEEKKPIRKSVPKLKLTDIPSLEEEEEEEEEIEEIKVKERKACGDYDEYSKEDEFFVCEEDEVCDVEKKRCVSSESDIPSSDYNLLKLEKDGKNYIFIGTKNNLVGLRNKLKTIRKDQEKIKKDLEKQMSVKKQEELRRLREEEQRMQEELERERKRLQEEEEEKIRLKEKQAREENERIQREQEEKNTRKKFEKKAEKVSKEVEKLEKEIESSDAAYVNLYSKYTGAIKETDGKREKLRKQREDAQKKRRQVLEDLKELSASLISEYDSIIKDYEKKINALSTLKREDTRSRMLKNAEETKTKKEQELYASKKKEIEALSKSQEELTNEIEKNDDAIEKDQERLKQLAYELQLQEEKKAKALQEEEMKREREREEMEKKDRERIKREREEREKEEEKRRKESEKRDREEAERREKEKIAQKKKEEEERRMKVEKKVEKKKIVEEDEGEDIDILFATTKTLGKLDLSPEAMLGKKEEKKVEVEVAEEDQLYDQEEEEEEEEEKELEKEIEEKEAESEEEEIEEEKLQEEIQEEIIRDTEKEEEKVYEEEEETPQLAVDFEELQKSLKNILRDSRVSTGKEFLSIPKKVSYCVGLYV